MPGFTKTPALVLALAAAPALHAQEGASAPSAPLTLEQAIGIARENNPTYRTATAELATVPALERGLWAAYLPAPSISFGTGLNLTRTYSAIDELGRPVRLDDPEWQTTSSSSHGLAFGSILLFDGGQRIADARADRARARGIRASAELAGIDLRNRLSTAYYGVVVADREIALNERMLASAREAQEGTERLLRVGLKDPLDMLSAELAVAEAEHALERSRGAARLARLELGSEMGVGREVTETLTDALPGVFDPSALDAEALAAAALGASPTVARLEASAMAAGHSISMARSQRWPRISLSGSSGGGVAGRGSEGLFDLDLRDQSYRVSLSISMPLFDQFRTSDAITQARVGQVTAEENLRAGRLDLENRIRAAVIDLQNAYREIQLAERTAGLSRQRLELATQRYELGGSTFEEFRIASDDAFAREHAVLLAQRAFATALLALEAATGGPVR